MVSDKKILVGKSGEKNVYIYPQMAARHGLICGATGTGKSMTLRVLAESFSDLGVPVFLADAKGDLSGFTLSGVPSDNITSRIEKLGLSNFKYSSFPASLWDVYGKNGIPLRTTVSEMGPMLLSRILGLNDTQTAIMNIIFHIADEEELLLIDLKDMRAMIAHVQENAKTYSAQYGNMASQSLSAILRSITALEGEGGEKFFAEPALDIKDWFRTDSLGRGYIEVLDCRELMMSPTMYATFMLWMISELFETLPEAGDLDKPKLVFFFDEAHMLFSSAPKILLDKITQLVKLIRSKGVGIYFITQNPTDIPDEVLSQLGNKIEHALRAYTPAEQKKLRAAAQSFRANPEFDTLTVLSELGIGEALVSVLDESGIPTMVERTTIVPPQSLTGAVDETQRRGMIATDSLYPKYGTYVDNFSAYEFFERRQSELDKEHQEELAKAADEKRKSLFKKEVGKAALNAGKAATGTVGREVGGTLGSMIGGKTGKKIGANVGASLGRGILATLFSRKK